MTECATKRAVWYAAKYFFFLLLLICAAVLLYGVFQLIQPQPDPQAAYNPGRQKIIVDAGHGGGDGGAVSASGLLEKELNLELSLVLRDMLCAAGYDVIMTRSDDSMLTWEGAPSAKSGDLRARTEIANANPDALFVSIHMNKFGDRSVSGPMAFYMKGSVEGEKLAKCVLDGVCGAIGRPLRHVNPGDYYIIKNSEPPSVILECGFLSNANDEALLQNEEHMRAMMKGAAEGILKYVEAAEGKSQ